MANRSLVIIFLIVFSGISLANDKGVDTSLLRELLEKRAQHSFIHAKVVQKKKLPSIAETLVSHGEVWMESNESFRWELGTPVTDLAILKGEKVFVYDLKKLTYEDHKVNSRSVRPIILLLGVGEKASYKGLLESFKPTAAESADGEYTVSFLPDSSLMKRALKELTIIFDVEKAFPKEVIWTQKDDTVITTSFSSPSFAPFDESKTFSLPTQEFKKK